VGSLAGSMRERRVVGAFALFACLSVLAGCGDSSTPPSPGTDGQPVVSVADIEAEKPGTPQYAALQWWQAVQFNKPELAQPLYAKEPSLPDLAGQFNVLEGVLDGVPKIEQLKGRGSRTVLVIDWTKREQRPHSTKVQLRMVRVGDRWKLADNRLLNVLLQQREERRQSHTG
jgi:hypothetical protein